jgi:uncharacterized membrane protein
MRTADGSPKRQRRTALLVLMALSALPVAVDSHALQMRSPLTVVFALDVSDSIDRPERSAGYITDTVQRHLDQRPADAGVQQGLVVFGRAPAVELSPARNFPFDAIKSQVDWGATNLGRALEMCAGLIGGDDQGRIVLISDGVQTEGDLTGVLAELKSRHVAVDVLPVEYSFDNEVWLEDLELPREARPGETYEAAVTVSSLGDGRGKLVLRDGDEVIDGRQVDYKAGRNRYAIPLAIHATGYHEFTATIEVPKDRDGRVQNNSVRKDLFVKGRGTVLLVVEPNQKPDADPAGNPGGGRDWTQFVQAVRDGGRDVDVAQGNGIPQTADALEFHDAIIFWNVPSPVFDPTQLQAVRDAVVDRGVGFLMTGGPNSFASGDYRGTAIEEILPVSMDAPAMRSTGALVIILDSSRFPEGNTWAKRLTKMAIKAMKPNDEVGVIAHTEKGEKWLVEMTLASNYEQIVPVINGARLGSLFGFQQVMEIGLKGLIAGKAARRHMLILSDGGPDLPPPKLIQDLHDANVSVSLVIINPLGGIESQKLHAIASQTGGHYYRTDDPSQLPAIFIKEAKSLQRSLLHETVFTPTIGTPSPVVDGLGELPKLRGYVLTTAKGGAAQQLLNGPAVADQQDAFDPILSVWPQGLGRVAAFTSDLGPHWGADWQKWDRFPTFVDQLMADICRPSHLKMLAYPSGREAVIEVEDLRSGASTLQIAATVSGPDGKSKTVVLQQTAPRTYRAGVPLWGNGRYHVTAQTREGARRALAVGGFGAIATYSPEHLQFHSNRRALQEIADRTGGRMLTGDPARDVVYAQSRSFKSESQASFDWFLIALAILVPIDAGLRRLWSEFPALWATAMHPPLVHATPTIVALMKTKQWVSSALSAKGTGRLLIQIWSPAPRSAPTKPRPPTTPAEPAAPESFVENAESPASTIEKLLAVKRRQERPPGE